MTCLISLPGLTLSIGEIGKFEMIMETALKAVYAFMEGKDSHLKVTEIEHPDVLCGWYGLYSNMPRWCHGMRHELNTVKP